MTHTQRTLRIVNRKRRQLPLLRGLRQRSILRTNPRPRLPQIKDALHVI